MENISKFFSIFKILFLPFTWVDKGLVYLANIISPQIVDFTNWLLSQTGKNFRVGDRFLGSVNFFIYDSFKIIILLSFMIFIISFVRSYFPPERVKKMLSKFNGIWANIIASILGVLSPF